MPPDLTPDADWERWLSVGVRSCHLAGVVWLGAGLLHGGVPARGAVALTVGAGLVMLVMDVLARRIALNEAAGGFVLAKLAVVAWMAWHPAHAVVLFWALVVASSVMSHAPKGFRHWPSKRPSARGGVRDRSPRRCATPRLAPAARRSRDSGRA